MMKVLQKIIFSFVMVIGLSLAASAQKPDDKKPTPPKEKPPVVTPAPTKPPPDTNKPKKPPGEEVAFWKRETGEMA